MDGKLHEDTKSLVVFDQTSVKDKLKMALKNTDGDRFFGAAIKAELSVIEDVVNRAIMDGQIAVNSVSLNLI